MFLKQLNQVMFFLTIQKLTCIVSDNENGNVQRDPIKIRRLVNFKIDLNATLYHFKEKLENITLIDALDDYLR